MHDDGFDLSSAAFPRRAIHCYRAVAVLPFLLIALLMTSVPFLVLSVIYWSDECLSGNAWWYRPTTVCGVSNVIVLCLAPLFVFVLAIPENSSRELKMGTFIAFSFLLVAMKMLQIASLIAAPLISHWCNASLIAIADLGAACVLAGTITGMWQYFDFSAYINESGVIDDAAIDLKELVSRIGVWSFTGCVSALLVPCGIVILFSVFGIHIACIIVAALSLAERDCSGSIWSNPPVPLMVTSMLSLLVMTLITIFACSRCIWERLRRCRHAGRSSLVMAPFFALSMAGAGWICYSLVSGGCDTADRVWWFGCVQALYCFITPLIWGVGIGVMRCAERLRPKWGLDWSDKQEFDIDSDDFSGRSFLDEDIGYYDDMLDGCECCRLCSYSDAKRYESISRIGEWSE